MKPLSASKAAAAVGKSVPTITRAIKSGKLSATVLDGGGYEIDPSELFRVWPAVKRNPDAKGQMLGSETPNETRELQAKVEALHGEKVAALEKLVDDLRTERDEWRKQAQQLALTDQRKPASDPETPNARLGWIAGLFGTGRKGA